MSVLSQTAAYALRAVLYLANVVDEDRWVGADEIAGALGIPASYLSKTLQALVRSGVLTSAMGRGGGFRLAAPPALLTLDRVVAPFEPGSEQRHCLLGRSTCSDATACAAHHAWKATSDQIAGFFRTTCVADIQGPLPTIATTPAPRRAAQG